MIRMKTITIEHARQFIGKDGAYEYVRQSGCIQYDLLLNGLFSAIVKLCFGGGSCENETF